MSLRFERIKTGEAEAVAEWLSSDTWPHLINTTQTWENVIARIAEGHFFGASEESYWVYEGTVAVGFIEIYHLHRLAPTFSIRLKSAFRGKGYGQGILKWVTDHIFTKYPDKRRIEARVREDNVAMRKLFNRCGYVKEAHFRMAFPTDDGRRMNSIGYAILRDDWETKGRTPLDVDSFNDIDLV